MPIFLVNKAIALCCIALFIRGIILTIILPADDVKAIAKSYFLGGRVVGQSQISTNK